MLRFFTRLSICFALLILTSFAQQSADAGKLPRLIRYTGTLTEPSGTPRTGMVGVMFSLYAQQQGGSALWTELQNVQLDANGNYTVLLGAQHSDGVPAELFTTNEARWLGIQVEADAEQPRVLLVSVPYALKAGDAETLGGLPASAFVQAVAGGTGSGAGTASGGGGTEASAAGTIVPYSVNTSTSGGTAGYVARWSDASTLGNSLLFDNGTNLGIGTTSPASKLDIQTSSATPTNALNVASTLTNSTANSGVITALNLRVTDLSTATNVSKQTMRMSYIRDANATGGVSVFDTIFTATPIINGNAPYTLIGLNMEAPNVAAGKTLGTFYGALIGAGGSSGTVTNRYALATAPGAGNVGLNTTTPIAPLNLVADNPGGAERASQFVVQGSTNPNLKLNIGLHTEASPAYADLSAVEENVAWRNIVLEKNGGFVGIGTTTPSNKLTVAGTIESTTGGIKFPDASVQATAGLTNVSATNGIIGSAGAGLLTLSADTSYVQKRISGTCATGSAVATVNADGTVTCQTVSGGSGGLTIPSSYTGSTPSALVFFTQSNSTALVSDPTFSQALSSIPAGIAGYASTTSNTAVGVFGGSSSISGPAIVGWNGSTTGTNDSANGVLGITDNPIGTAIEGYARPTTGNTVGVRGKIKSANGIAIVGETSGSGGMAGSFDGPVVITSTLTVNSLTPPSCNNPPCNLVVNGGLFVNGQLSKQSGSFKIDDPLDPANKYLYHSFVESPDMKNVYDGVAVLDARGQAWIELPGYFQALNQDFRYQLTAIGAPGPNLYIAHEIQGNRFRIAGGKPHAKVSWQVTGIRHDAYADAHRIPNEVEKPATERGTYLSPELFGQQAAKTAHGSKSTTASSPIGSSK